MLTLDPVASLVALAPALLLFAAALVVMIGEAVVRPASKVGFWALSLAALLGAGVLAAGNFGAEPAYAFSGMVRVDSYAAFFNVVAALSASSRC